LAFPSAVPNTARSDHQFESHEFWPRLGKPRIINGLGRERAAFCS
jgi:hypothetical protein